MNVDTPVYIDTCHRGVLRDKTASARKMLSHCTMCPRKCRVDRLSGESGVCKTSGHAVVAAAEAHFGEEAPLVGTHGSGTIFFSYCSLLCKFCQNYDISHKGYGRAVSSEELADMMISLQRLGCHNINLVTPSHVVFQILESIPLAVEKGLRIPLIYNSSGYDAVETLRLLDGVVDIYMPDFKFWDPKVAQAACSAPDYPEIARTGISEMHRQVGDIVIGEDGVARRGLLLRHLVLPNAMAGTREVMRFVARELSRDTYVNIMNQYRPLAMASEVPGFERRPTRMEFESAVAEAGAEGIHRLDRPVRTFVLH